jgi:hypothetical protein
MDMSYTRVLHIKNRVPRTSQMTSRLLRHTAAAMRAHNVLFNSYNTRPLLCERITCYVTVITVEINHCSFRRVRFFTRIGCTLLTCDMYVSDLRHIREPVLSSLKMEGVRLLFNIAAWNSVVNFVVFLINRIEPGAQKFFLTLSVLVKR